MPFFKSFGVVLLSICLGCFCYDCSIVYFCDWVWVWVQGPWVQENWGAAGLRSGCAWGKRAGLASMASSLLMIASNVWPSWFFSFWVTVSLLACRSQSGAGFDVRFWFWAVSFFLVFWLRLVFPFFGAVRFVPFFWLFWPEFWFPFWLALQFRSFDLEGPLFLSTSLVPLRWKNLHSA